MTIFADILLGIAAYVIAVGFIQLHAHNHP